MTALRQLPEPFWTVIAVVKTLTKSLRHNQVLPSGEHCDWAVKSAQIIFGWKTVTQDPPDRENRHVRLGDIREPIERRKENGAGDLVRIMAGQIGRNTGAERFAQNINRIVGAEELQRLTGRFLKRGFAG